MEKVYYDERAKRFITRLQREDFMQLDAIVARYRDKPGYLIPALKDAQSLVDFFPWRSSTTWPRVSEYLPATFTVWLPSMHFLPPFPGQACGSLLHGHSLLCKRGGRDREDNGGYPVHQSGRNHP